MVKRLRAYIKMQRAYRMGGHNPFEVELLRNQEDVLLKLAEKDPFVELVQKMREAQMAYFRDRSQENLKLAKRLEKEVDAAVFQKLLLEKKNGKE